MQVGELLLLIVLGLGTWFWLDTLRAREAGVRAARAACEREGVQLLDETVAGRSVRPARDDNGRLVLWRAYDFDYSTSGYDRHRGSVVLCGGEVILVDVGAHREA